MADVQYPFTELDSDASFQLLGQTLGGTLDTNTLHFDNSLAKGELIKISPEDGLYVRKWKFTVYQKIILQKQAATISEEKKFILIYFLNPSIFLLNNKTRNIPVKGPRNNVFFTSDIPMDFSVAPKQPFYVIDITFTTSWLFTQITDADQSLKKVLESFLNNSKEVLIEPSTVEEFKILHELDKWMLAENEDPLFIKSRVYNLIVSFFNKLVNKSAKNLVNSRLHYQQIIEAEMMIMEDVRKTPKIGEIASKVNMSISSLLRQFKLLYGKSVHEYYVERKMELAKKLIIGSGISIKELANMLGYNQPSSFIETFSKQFGCSPGSLKLASEHSFV